MHATLVLPHQLFDPHPAVARGRVVLLVEDSLFFGDRHAPARFHQQKLVLHRASMAAFAEKLAARGFAVRTIAYDPVATIVDVAAGLARDGFTDLHFAEPHDYLLERRLQRAAAAHGLRLHRSASPMFLTPRAWLDGFFAQEPRYFMHRFYIAQRKRLGVLLDANGGPLGGAWSFDAENRRRLPAGHVPPAPPRQAHGPGTRAAIASVAAEFAGNPGRADDFWFPVTHGQARAWLRNFLAERLGGFGDYEDAIAARHDVLYHAVLTPMLNIGLLTPREVLDETLAVARERETPLNALEGFVRQIIGWREFMRAIYEREGVRERTANFFRHARPLPRAFYTATTGIPPVDTAIRRVLDRCYTHHIERLMVLGTFMLLCRIRPDDVYRWFMELFIDAYDWVMVPNVYGMSQFADGGLFATKPYLCGSNYILKMSDHPRGPWCEVWDALYWTFIADHRDFFASHPRLAVMPRQLDRMGGARLAEHRHRAAQFLASPGLQAV